MAEQTTTNSSSDEISELESWRQVHRTLINAVIVAEEAVAIQKAQRRYWLEEIAANLDEEGTSLHQSTSIWKRPVIIKRQPSKRATVKKRKKASANESAPSPKPKPTKKPRKKKSVDGSKTSRPAKPKKSAAPAARSIPENISPAPSTKSADDEDSAELVEAEEDAEEVASGEGADDSSDRMVVPEYAQVADAYPHSGHAPAAETQQHAHWGEPGAHNLQMMAAVAFGANPVASYPSTAPTMHHPPQHHHHHAPPPPYNPHYYHHPYPPHHYHHHHPQAPQYQPQRTYASLEDVNSEDDDSDQNKF